MNKIEEIIKIEWKMFQKVENIGGRASCQDDSETFYIMRRSQYDNWSEEMVDIYYDFLQGAAKDGRNLVSEKYARMMAYTDLHYYNKHIKGNLPFVPVKNYRIINLIVEQLIAWEEDMAQKYPAFPAPDALSGRKPTQAGSLLWKPTHAASWKLTRKNCFPYT